MPFPVVAATVGIVATVVSGLAVGVNGGLKMRKAKLMQKDAAQAHEAGLAAFREVENRTQECAAEYGILQLEVQAETFGAWVEWLELYEKKVRRVARSVVDGVEIEAPDIPRLRAQVVESIGLLAGGVTTAVTGTAAYFSALWGVGAFATASTGTTIASLSGAAATNATLAWLGGGAVAAGGGGMALGGLMLSGVTAAPVALVAGLGVGVQGQRALTRAAEISAGVEVALAEMDAKKELLGRVEERIAELRSVLEDVKSRARASLGELSSRDFEPDRDLALFQTTALLMRAVGEILATPIVDADGRPTEQSLAITERYSR